ncbi:Translin [Lamellibrachia satsuma]|nr:Translin [Lamellibrachia satsuma]
MSFSSSTTDIFAAFQDHINRDQDVREEIRAAVRELEQKARALQTVLHAIHQTEGVVQLKVICETAESKFEGIRQQMKELKEKVPTDQYYRYNDHWRFMMQRLCFLAALVVYLESERLIDHVAAAERLGVAVKREDGFHLDLDDFLMGLLQLASELSRLTVNAVTAGDYARPMRIAKFVGDLDAGFRLLNLKNDSLRKRFDVLKYDLKKIEEVVYDVTIRGLRPKAPETEAVQ